RPLLHWYRPLSCRYWAALAAYTWSSSKIPADPAAHPQYEPDCRPSPPFDSFWLPALEPGRLPAGRPAIRSRSGRSNPLLKREIDESSEISFSLVRTICRALGKGQETLNCSGGLFFEAARYRACASRTAGDVTIAGLSAVKEL